MKRKRGGKMARRAVKSVKRAKKSVSKSSRTSKLSKRKKKFNLLDFFKGKYFVYAAVGVFLVFAFALVISNAGQGNITTRQTENVGGTGTGTQFLSEGTIRKIAEVIAKDYFRLGETPVKTPGGEKLVQEILGESPLGDTGVAIVYIMVWLILFVSFAYVLGNFLFKKEEWRAVPWFIAFGMAVITANFGLVANLVAGMAAVTSALGAFAVFGAIGFAFITFFLVSFFNNLFRIRRAKAQAKAAEAGGIRAEGATKAILKHGEAYEGGGGI